jgi:hypothetical protein
MWYMCRPQSRDGPVHFRGSFPVGCDVLLSPWRVCIAGVRCVSASRNMYSVIIFVGCLSSAMSVGSGSRGSFAHNSGVGTNGSTAGVSRLSCNGVVSVSSMTGVAWVSGSLVSISTLSECIYCVDVRIGSALDRVVYEVPDAEAVAFTICPQVVPTEVSGGVLTPRRFRHT